MEDEVSSIIVEGVRHLPPRRSDLYSLGEMGYVIGKKIGEGTYARVHKAYYFHSVKGLKLLLACKIFNLKDAPTVFNTVFFPRELSIIASLRHPHVVGLHSIILRDTKFFVFMIYGERGDLLAYIRDNGAMDESHAKVWYGQIISALEYLHNSGIVHRDLKCENIVITSRFNLKVGDFGFATFCNDDYKSRTFCGSLAYACPEITRGIPYRPRLADYWSSGVILFIMLNAAMPFKEKSIKKLVNCQMHKKYIHKYTCTTLTRDVIRLIDRILEPDPSRRYTLEKIKSSPWLRGVTIMSSVTQRKTIDQTEMREYFKKLIEEIALDENGDTIIRASDCSPKVQTEYKEICPPTEGEGQSTDVLHKLSTSQIKQKQYYKKPDFISTEHEIQEESVQTITEKKFIWKKLIDFPLFKKKSDRKEENSQHHHPDEAGDAAENIGTASVSIKKGRDAGNSTAWCGLLANIPSTSLPVYNELPEQRKIHHKFQQTNNDTRKLWHISAMPKKRNIILKGSEKPERSLSLQQRFKKSTSDVQGTKHAESNETGKRNLLRVHPFPRNRRTSPSAEKS